MTIKALELNKGNARIQVGYRSPGFSQTHSQEQKMELCQKHGMSIIEPQIAPNEMPDIETAIAYKEAADKYNIKITSAGIFVPYQIESKAQEVEEYGNFAIEVAKTLDIDYLFTLVNHPPEGIPHQQTWDLVKTRLHHFVSKAEQAGMVVSLEPEWFLGSVERVVKMIKEVDHKNFQMINFDATNFFTNGSDPRDCFNEHHSIIKNGHIKDGFYRTDVKGEAPVGEGEVPWKELFEIMLKNGGDYTMHIEHCRKEEQLESAVDYIRSVFDEIEKE
jgi:sugar phosphate isomerase/epimerase